MITRTLRRDGGAVQRSPIADFYRRLLDLLIRPCCFLLGCMAVCSMASRMRSATRFSCLFGKNEMVKRQMQGGLGVSAITNHGDRPIGEGFCRQLDAEQFR